MTMATFNFPDNFLVPLFCLFPWEPSAAEERIKTLALDRNEYEPGIPLRRAASLRG